ncbi:MAG: copper chaperone PCu(A)C, partial [Fimbriimonadaceae bacterium]|nr:copper chaperone PCu(A)C [Alphaproteobacteria bacterium]
MKSFKHNLSAITFVSLAFFALFLAGGILKTNAQEVTAGDLTLIHPWVRVMPAAAKVGAGYVTITNGSDKDDRLMSATSPAADQVEIHEMSMDNGVMRMRPLADGLVIPAGNTVELAPGGFHIMFKKVTAPFEKDTMVPVTLHFMNAGAVNVDFRAGEAASSENMPMNMNDDKPMNMNHGDGQSGMSHGDDQK